VPRFPKFAIHRGTAVTTFGFNGARDGIMLRLWRGVDRHRAAAAQNLMA